MQMIWRQVKSTENDSRQRVFCADPLGTLAMLMVCSNPAAYHAQRYGLMMSPLDKCENAKARRCVQSKALTAQCRSMEFDGWLNGKGFLHSCVSLEAACKELLLVVTSGWAKCKYPAVLSNSSECFHEWIDFLYIYFYVAGLFANRYKFHLSKLTRIYIYKLPFRANPLMQKLRGIKWKQMRNQNK